MLEMPLIKELNLENNFDYQKLYNDSRGAVHKEDYKSLLKWCIEENVISIKKYLIKENIHPDLLYDIADRSGKGNYQFKEGLKDYHQESDYKVAPFIYLVELIEPKYKINMSREKYEDPILESPKNILVGHRFQGTNAFSRLYLDDGKIAVNSDNDSIENLMDTLEIDEITVYVLAIEGEFRREQDIVVYKLTKNEKFNKLKDYAEHRFLEELQKLIIQI